MNAKQRTNGTAPAPAPAPAAALPEAPASATAKFNSPAGVEWLLTVRDHTVYGLMTKASHLEEYLLNHDWTPANDRSRSNGSAPTSAGGPVCPAHGSPMKQSKHRPGEWYCPQKIADDDGTGRPAYCRQKSK